MQAEEAKARLAEEAARLRAQVAAAELERERRQAEVCPRLCARGHAAPAALWRWQSSAEVATWRGEAERLRAEASADLLRQHETSGAQARVGAPSRRRAVTARTWRRGAAVPQTEAELVSLQGRFERLQAEKLEGEVARAKVTACAARVFPRACTRTRECAGRLRPTVEHCKGSWSGRRRTWW